MGFNIDGRPFDDEYRRVPDRYAIETVQRADASRDQIHPDWLLEDDTGYGNRRTVETARIAGDSVGLP